MITLAIFIGIITCLQVVLMVALVYVYYQIKALQKNQDAIFDTCTKTEGYFEVMQVNESILAGEN